jgi:hypothetical protein
MIHFWDKLIYMAITKNGGKWMFLREHLEECTREQLLDQARTFELRKCSQLRKAELIDRIVEEYCTEEMMRARLACLTKDQIALFRRACCAPQDISINEVADGMQLCMYWLGGFEEETDRFCVFEEVAEIFGKIDDVSFKEEQTKKGWMMECVHFFIEYYGIAPVEIIYELYRLKAKGTIDEMIDLLWSMPVDMVASCIFPMDKLGMEDWPREDPLYSSKGLLVYLPILEDDEFGYLLRQQMDKEFYIPSVQQIDEINRIKYEASCPAYKKLEIFFQRKMHMPYENAVSWSLQVWVNSYDGESPMEMLNKLADAGIEFEKDEQMEELMGLLMDAHNNTRMKENRGHKPNELRRKRFAGGMPTVVPGSSHAAAMLREAAPELKAMGIPIDLEGGADTIATTMYPDGIDGKSIKVEKKIYPNDPCPCGSGKKYKKCCGR